MDNWSDPFHSCCRSARHNNFILNTAITNRGAVELVDLMDIGKCISATKQEILLPFIQKYFWFLGSQRNMQFHFQQAGKKSSPTKVTRHRGAQYGKHFPSISPLPFCGSQKCTEQSALLPKPPSASPNTTSACDHLCAKGRQCPQTAQQSSSWAEGARPLKGCSWDAFYTGDKQTTQPLQISTRGEIKE